jgi:hypothetical protein
MSAQIAHLDRPAPRHIRVSGPRLTFRYERCERTGCVVTPAGVGSACGEPACLGCGSGGANLTRVSSGSHPVETKMHCTCGCVFVSELPRAVSLSLLVAPALVAR